MILGIRLSSFDLVLRLEDSVELLTVFCVGVVGDVTGLTDADWDLFRWRLLMVLGRRDGAASDETRSRMSELLGVADFTNFWKKLGAIHSWLYLIMLTAVLHSKCPYSWATTAM
jgi:hypothetical protein